MVLHLMLQDYQHWSQVCYGCIGDFACEWFTAILLNNIWVSWVIYSYSWLIHLYFWTFFCILMSWMFLSLLSKMFMTFLRKKMFRMLCLIIYLEHLQACSMYILKHQNFTLILMFCGFIDEFLLLGCSE